MARRSEVGPAQANAGAAVTSVEERRELGGPAGQSCPALAECKVPQHRPDPVALLQSQDVSRISELVPVRYKLMLASPLAFLRGAALIMASDLAAGADTGLSVQLCGDAHPCNFGLFGSAKRNLGFDIKDFDETLPGPWEWDIKRLVASLAVTGRVNGFPAKERERVVRGCAKVYRERMQTLAAMRELVLWYAETCVDGSLPGSLDPTSAAVVKPSAAKARSRDSVQALSKLTYMVESLQLLVDYGHACGKVLARAHARTGDRIAIAGYLGTGDDADTALTQFAESYADQNERDYAASQEAAQTHRVPVGEAADHE